MTDFTKRILGYRALLFVLLVSLVIKAVLLLQHPVVNPDAVVYIAAAESFSKGDFAEGASHYRMPLYPLLLTLFHFLVPNWIIAGQLLHALFLLLSVIPLYFLTVNLFNRSAAFFAALLFAILPVFNGAGSITRDPPFLFLVLCALALLSADVEKFSTKRFMLAGLLVVLATLIRIEGIVLLVLLPIMVFWQHRNRLTTNKAVKISTLTFISVGFLFLVVWMFNLLGFGTHSRLTDIFSWVQRIQTLNEYYALMDFLREVQNETPRGYMKRNLIAKARHFAPVIYFLSVLEMIIAQVMLTSVIALWGLRWRKEPLLQPQRIIIVWPWVVFFMVGFVFFMLRDFIVTRYVWIPIALTVPFVGYGMTLWCQKYRDKTILIVCVMFLFFAPPAAKIIAEFGKDHRDSVREMGRWLLEQDPHRQLNVFHNDRRFSLYAGRAGEHSKSVRGLMEDNKVIDLFSVDADIVMFRFNSRRVESLDFTGVKILAENDDGRSVSFALSKKSE